MVYDPNTPENAEESPAVSQKKITANFQEIKTFFEENHTTINNAGQGKHKFLTMPKQDGAPAVGADELAFYVKEKDSTLNLFQKDGEGTEKQVIPEATVQQDGKLVMPGGLIFLWGRSGVVDAQWAQDRGTMVFYVRFHQAFPNNCFVVTYCIAAYEGVPRRSDLHHLERDYFEVDAPLSGGSRKGNVNYFAVGN